MVIWKRRGGAGQKIKILLGAGVSRRKRADAGQKNIILAGSKILEVRLGKMQIAPGRKYKYQRPQILGERLGKMLFGAGERTKY